MKRMATVASAAVVVMLGVGAIAGQTPPDDFKKGAYTEDTPDLVPPKLIRQAEPKYTSEAMRRKIQGSVVVDAVVAADGTVARARLAESLDKDFGLDDEALKAVRAWKFEPGVLGGLRVPVLIQVTLTFRLH